MFGLDTFHQTLLRMEPEAAHDAAIRAMKAAQMSRLPLALIRHQCALKSSRLVQQFWNTRFPNPVGLAAGYDKNAQVIRGMAALGFGFLEVGTVTPLPQRGNPKPRVFRHPDQRSLQNALGFNNLGAESMARSLRAQEPFPVPVGVNVGKNKATPEEAAIDDYEMLVERLSPLADYLVINISSPNTPGLRDMQRLETTRELLSRCRERTKKPVLIKLAPDLADTEAIALGEAAVAGGAAGVVVTNTTVEYSLLPGVEPVGGLSGRVLKKRSLEMLRLLAGYLNGECRLISVGGIESAADAYQRFLAGATLVQIYTAMIYEGPLLVRRILEGLLELMDRDGVDRLEDLIGAEAGDRSTRTI